LPLLSFPRRRESRQIFWIHPRAGGDQVGDDNSFYDCYIILLIMSLILFHLVIFVVLLISLFFLSRYTINQLFYFFRHFLKNEKAVFRLISLIFFPGTVLHEFAHFFAAIVLFLRVRDIKIFPEWEDSNLKLGHVLYEKRDFVRGILVGMAPIFAGLLFFLALFAWRLFPQQNFLLNLLVIYFIFTVSSMMFSSKQDLLDLIYIPPVLILIAGIIYVFDIKIDILFQNENLGRLAITFLTQINFYLLISLSIHLGIILVLKIFMRKRNLFR